MKKVLICGVIAAAFGMTSAFAGSAIGDFQVTASVTPTCVANNPSMPTIAFGAIPAFDPTPIPNKTATVAFKCSKNLSPTGVSLSAATGTVAGLTYGLSVNTTPAVTTGTGVTGDGYAYTVTGTMAAGQAGDATAGTTDNQTLTISF